jgi:hypothetical protein
VRAPSPGSYSAITSGLVTGIIFLIIALSTGWTGGGAVLWALVVGAAAFGISYFINQTLARTKHRTQEHPQ